MKLLQIGTSLGSNGIANVMRGIASVWSSQTYYGVLESDEKNMAIWKPHRFWGRRKFLRYLPKVSEKSLENFCRKFHIQTMLLHYPPLDQIAYQVARNLKISVYYYYHNVTDIKFYVGKEKKRRQREDESMLNLMQKVDNIFCNSQFTAQKIKETTGREAWVATPAVDPDIYIPLEMQEKEEIKKKFRLVHVGRGVAHKGLRELLQIIHDLLAQDPHLHFDYVGSLGEDAYGFDCQNLLTHPQITWHQKIDDSEKIKILQKADLFVSASQFEGFGMPFLEAASCGLPSVGYRTTAIPEAVPAGGGTLVETGNVQAFRQEIEGYMNDPKRVLKHGLQARKWAAGRTWERSVHVIKRVMEKESYKE